MVKADDNLDDKEDKEKWELEHDLWDFLNWLPSQELVLARWHHMYNPGKESERRHNKGDHSFCRDELLPTTGYSERRNLPRKFLELESWEESERKADQLLKELREKSKVARQK